MEVLGLLIFIVIIGRLLIWSFPTNIFTSPSGFWTGFWIYVWSTSIFTKLIKVILISFSIVLLLTFFTVILKILY